MLRNLHRDAISAKDYWRLVFKLQRAFGPFSYFISSPLHLLVFSSLW